tara:strand:+ start:287 stop:613 length:327 start_codon:yes stop_codon:yes gene_type:complete
MGFKDFKLKIGNFLNKEIINNSFISIDVWSILHVIAGMIIFFFLFSFLESISFMFIMLFVILVFWEFFEFVNYGILKNNLFLSESLVNVIWDIIFGMLGGFLILKIIF